MRRWRLLKLDAKGFVEEFLGGKVDVARHKTNQ